MCFSARASFLAGGLLMAIGTASIKRVTDSRQYMFASIPFIFGFQQIVEGIVWLTIGNSSGILSSINSAMVYMYLSLAFIIWPVWVPLSIFLIEKDIKRKCAIGLAIICGAGVSVYFLSNFLQHGAFARGLSCHIYYHLNLPDHFEEYTAIFYLIPTVLPLFISSVRYMWILAIALLISYVLAVVIWQFFLVSVWCFFVAALSGIIYFVMGELTKRKRSYVELF